MSTEEIVAKTKAHVQQQFTGESSGHDWWHIYRVWQLSLHIAKKEQANLLTVQLGALLHDIADFKFHDGDETVGPRVAREWLESLSVDEEVIKNVCEIITKISFKGAHVANTMTLLEGQIVQDADRLDAIGAIGIARAFAYGGFAGREMYDPHKKPELHTDPEKYKNNTSPTISHFYEKLLLLKDRMHTKTAKKLAAHRHTYMEEFLAEFYEEWDGIK
jgi:uncharacterized protein